MTTKIEWAQNPDGTPGETWNPIRARNKKTGKVGHFCVHVSPGCENCYAEKFQSRFGNPVRYAAQDRAKVEVFLDTGVLAKPLHWRKPRRIFVSSMTDLFGDWVGDEWIDRVLGVAALCPQHTFIVLTKRAERMREYMTRPFMGKLTWGVADRMACDLLIAEGHSGGPYLEAGGLAAPWPLPNVWLGVSAEDQTRADERIPVLLDTPAAVRFISVEPMLGPVDFPRRWTGPFAPSEYGSVYPTTLDWVIVGGESGPGARPFNIAWARSIIAQCREAGGAVFFKQAGSHPIMDGVPLRLKDRKGGELSELPRDLQIREWPDANP